MTTTELLDNLARRGVTVTARDDRLKFDAPPGVVTAADLEELKSHKAEIIAALRPRKQPLTIVTDPDGCVRFSNPPDLRKVLVVSARRKGCPALGDVPAGEAAWINAARFSSIERVAELLLALDDHRSEAA